MRFSALDDQARVLVQRRLSDLFVEKCNGIREINSAYEHERKRLEKMLETGRIPQTIG